MSCPARASCCGRGASTYQLEQPPSTQTVPRMRALDPVVEGRLCLRPGVDHGRAAGVHRPQRVHHVGQLRLDDEDDRVVPEQGVRADQQEEVGEAGDRGAAQRLHPAVAPRSSASRRPSRPRKRARRSISVARKPVPQTIVSTSCSRPSAVTTPRGRIARHRVRRPAPRWAAAAPGSSRSRAGSACSRSRSPASARARSSGSGTWTLEVLERDLPRRPAEPVPFEAAARRSRGPSRRRRASPAGAPAGACTARRSLGRTGRPGWGRIQGGVRWKTVSCSTSRLDPRHHLDRARRRCRSPQRGGRAGRAPRPSGQCGRRRPRSSRARAGRGPKAC